MITFITFIPKNEYLKSGTKIKYDHSRQYHTYYDLDASELLTVQFLTVSNLLIYSVISIDILHHKLYDFEPKITHLDSINSLVTKFQKVLISCTL